MIEENKQAIANVIAILRALIDAEDDAYDPGGARSAQYFAADGAVTYLEELIESE